MAINNNVQSSNQKSNQKEAKVWLRPRLVIRNKEGEVIDEVWFTKDIPLDNNSKAVATILKTLEKRPEYKFELSATGNIPSERDENDVYELY